MKKRQGKGNQAERIGFGLNTMRNLCKVMGGNIFVRSTEGIGTQVIFAIQMRGHSIKLDQKDMQLQTQEIKENYIAPIVELS